MCNCGVLCYAYKMDLLGVCTVLDLSVYFSVDCLLWLPAFGNNTLYTLFGQNKPVTSFPCAVIFHVKKKKKCRGKSTAIGISSRWQIDILRHFESIKEARWGNVNHGAWTTITSDSEKKAIHDPWPYWRELFYFFIFLTFQSLKLSHDFCFFFYHRLNHL